MTDIMLWICFWPIIRHVPSVCVVKYYTNNNKDTQISQPNIYLTHININKTVKCLNSK